MDLQQLRAHLDRTDRRIVEALADRLELVRAVALLKGEGTDRLRDDAREAELLDRLDAVADEVGLDRWLIRQLYRSILDHSVRMQEEHLVDRDNPDARGIQPRVGYQGTDGCYSHMAGARHFAAQARKPVFRGFDTFRELLEAVRDGIVDRAMLPIENTTAGSINENYDLLATMHLSLVGEEVLEVEHCLLALADVPLTQIRRIRSHPQALAQCSEFLGRFTNCLVEAYADTAMAARAVAQEQDLSQAAIASASAAERFGLVVLRKGIANQPRNYTRFVVVAREPVVVDPRIPCKTSVLFATRHEQGALLRALNVLGERHLNLTKLESRPRPARPWEYVFYVDFEGNRDDPVVADALVALAPVVDGLEILGSYPTRPRPEAP